MLKKFRYILPAVLLLIALTVTGCGTANASFTDAPSGRAAEPARIAVAELTVDDGWTVLSMDVAIDVSDDRSACVAEEFAVRYNKNGKYGFYHDLPVNSGEKYRDVKVTGAPFAFERSSGLLSIRVGSEEKIYYAGDEARYKISYMLIPPETDDLDAYYMNAVGFGFSTEILTVNITMNFPAEPAETPKFYVGDYGNTNESDIEQSVNGSTVKATVNGLRPYQGVTAGLIFPDGTFKRHTSAEFVLALVLGVVLVGIIAALKLTVGRSKEIIPISSYYPPEMNGKRLSPVQLGMLIDGTCSTEDVTSLIFYWAGKGYLELVEEGDDMRMIYKSSLPDDAPAYEKIMFNKLFATASETTTEALKEKFYPAVTAVQSGVKREYGNKLYDSRIGILSMVLTVLAGLYIGGLILLAYHRISSAYFSFHGLLAGLPAVLLYAFGGYLAMHWVKLSGKRYPLLLAFGLVSLVVCFVSVTLVPADVMGWGERAIIASCAAVAMFIAPFITKRTEFYTHTLGEVVGFRDFIMLAEKDKLEMLLADNPQYYYDVLPYANVLGVSDIWEDKFKDLTVEPPVYYRNSVGKAMFNLMLFNAMYRRSFTRFRTAATTRPAPTSHSGGGGGFRSGGGFGGGGGGRAGGGFGGGGGRSW